MFWFNLNFGVHRQVLFVEHMPYNLRMLMDTASIQVLGPLHTLAKSRDREIVRAQKKVFKGRPNTPPKSCSVVTDPQE